ncbi:type 2 periplasmic-binding domain-containing protein [Falsigemmobacter faecalis]|uniref:Molybdate ABC transporter substrate-binding protein n=1 Tax=Falsigemmobacter faecalis TaxID=2488730 RepID=A0A3P3DFQ6_9RHOB|nr:hypothetical protein [Falsigemmobacter faecalis]RRH72496.1 hypothetical protein EG244_14645 [Falsigemmobacter faecalis]
MKLLCAAALLSLSLTLPAGAEVIVATDPDFAPVATELAQRLGAADFRVLALQPAALERAEADLILGPDTALADRLIASGAALAPGRVTYAMGRSGTEEAVNPRDGVLMQRAAENAAARDFLDFLLTPEAWDVIVAAGFGAH